MRTATSVALVAAAALLCMSGVDGFARNVPGNGGCVGFQFTIKKSEYNYTIDLGEDQAGTGCLPSDLLISKLYLPGACAKSRLNGFEFASLNPTNINCNTVESFDEKTCNTVFSEAPASAIVTNLTQGDRIDTDNVCWPADVGFIFVKNNCKSDTNVAVDAHINSYNGAGCQIVGLGFGNKVGLHPGAIAGIVIGVIVVIILLGVCFWCICCQLRKR